MSKNGENLYKRKDGRWEGRYIKGRKEDGAIWYGYVYDRSYQNAKRILRQKRLEYEGKEYSKNKKETCQHWIEKWLNQKNREVRKSTYMSYRSKLYTHILPEFGQKELWALSEKDLVQWKTRLERNLKTDSAASVCRVFKQCLIQAQKEGLLKIDSLDVLTMANEPVVKIKALSKPMQENLERFLDSKENLPILLALDTGMRIGEICGLMWEDINWEQRSIEVCQNFQRVLAEKAGYRKTECMLLPPKSYSSIRVIPMTNRLYNRLKAEYQEDKRFVFYGMKKNAPIDPRTLRYRFKRVLEQAELPDFTFHSLRHTFATRCIESGASVVTVSSLLGHKSTQLTLDTYAHSFIGEKQKAIHLLEKYV